MQKPRSFRQSCALFLAAKRKGACSQTNLTSLFFPDKAIVESAVWGGIAGDAQGNRIDEFRRIVAPFIIETNLRAVGVEEFARNDDGKPIVFNGVVKLADLLPFFSVPFAERRFRTVDDALVNEEVVSVPAV